ncbi:MAG: DNA-directed RNA polymerase subunit alpha C-terminal domain-containing protein [archaeon]
MQVRGIVDKIGEKMRKRKLNQEQERDVALSYLCGVSTDFISSRYDVSVSTIGKYVKERDDPLANHYRQTNPWNKDLNAAHLWLYFGCEGVEPTGLIDQERDRVVFDMVDEAVFIPGIESIVERTSLDEYVARKNPYDNLMTALRGNLDANRSVRNGLIEVLESVYEPGKKLSLRDVFEEVGDRVIDKVIEGGLTWTDLKKGLVHEALDTLTEREKKIIGDRFGLDGYDVPKDQKEIGTTYGFSHERIRQVEARALRRLRHPLRYNKFRILSDLSTDEDVREFQYQNERREIRDELYSEIKAEVESDFLDDKKFKETYGMSRNVANKPIEDLELSVRTFSCLQGKGIKYISDFADITEVDLLKTKNFGRKSLNEIKEELSRLGVTLKNR